MNAHFIGEFDALSASYVGCEDKKTRLYRVCQDCNNGFKQIPHLELRQLRKCDVESIRSRGLDPDRHFIVSGSYICPKCGSVASFISDPISIDDTEIELDKNEYYIMDIFKNSNSALRDHIFSYPYISCVKTIEIDPKKLSISLIANYTLKAMDTNTGNTLIYEYMHKVIDWEQYVMPIINSQYFANTRNTTSGLR